MRSFWHRRSVRSRWFRHKADVPGESALFHPCALARATTFRPTRTVDGQPDLQGFWRGPASGTENVEEHPMTDDDNGGKSLIVEPSRREGAVSAMGGGFAERKQRQVCRAERTLLSFGRPSLVICTDSDRNPSDLRQRADPVRASAHLPNHSGRPASPRGGSDRFVDGRLTRPLGWKHARGRRDQSQREDLVRSSRKLSLPGRTHGRTLHADRSGHDSLPGAHRRCECLYATVDDGHAAAAKQGERDSVSSKRPVTKESETPIP